MGCARRFLLSQGVDNDKIKVFDVPCRYQLFVAECVKFRADREIDDEEEDRDEKPISLMRNLVRVAPPRGV